MRRYNSLRKYDYKCLGGGGEPLSMDREYAAQESAADGDTGLRLCSLDVSKPGIMIRNLLLLSVLATMTPAAFRE